MRGFLDSVKQSFDWVSMPKFAVTDVIEILLIAFLIYQAANQCGKANGKNAYRSHFFPILSVSD